MSRGGAFSRVRRIPLRKSSWTNDKRSPRLAISRRASEKIGLFKTKSRQTSHRLPRICVQQRPIFNRSRRRFDFVRLCDLAPLSRGLNSLMLLQIAEAQRVAEASLQALKPDNEQAKAIANEIDVLEKEVALKQESLVSLLSDQTKFDTEIRRLETKCSQLEREITAITQEVENSKTAIQLEKQAAISKGVSPDTPTNRSSPEIQLEIKTLERQLQQRSKETGSIEEITKDYHAKSKQFEATVSTLKNLKDITSRIDKVLATRKVAFKTLRDYLVMRVKYLFSMFLSQKGFQGKIDVDHGEETLTLRVNVDTASKSTNTGGVTLSLSGGERSFATVAFVVSLWEAMDCPFRCLDEFDVHMVSRVQAHLPAILPSLAALQDMVNRRLSMKSLIDLARSQKSRQFIFLTPQSLLPMNYGLDVRIHRLKDPERNQSVLSFDSQP
eukprot:m.168979 g.168979  ORF g.168979 m.168979 type:complete len:441 (-) comp53212_c0_seq67:55-1377(-)